MTSDLKIYTGTLTYNGVNFSFVFDKKELRLISPAEKKGVVSKWLLEELAEGVYTFGNPIYIEEPYLLGKISETGQTIIFFPTSKSNIGSYNSMLLVDIFAYIIVKHEQSLIDRISFQSHELDYIYQVNHALGPFSWSNDGVICFNTKNFNETTSEKQSFKVDGKSVTVQFGVSRTVKIEIGQAPLSLKGTMFFDFEPTSDYLFILRLWEIAKSFVQYLCYRKNTSMPSASIWAPYEDGKHIEFATLFIVNESTIPEKDSLEKGRYIRQVLINGFEGKILSDIADDTIYLRHLPSSYSEGGHIDAARFVMITAAFEWEFHRSYPQGVPKKKARLEVEEKAIEAMDVLIEGCSGALKKKYKFLKKKIRSDSLQNEIEEIGKEYANIIDLFGNHLFKINDEKLNYTEMGMRLADQRNHFAHGNIDKEFIGLSLLDLIFLEYIVYAMQLHFYGIETKNIQKAINELFHRSIAL